MNAVNVFGRENIHLFVDETNLVQNTREMVTSFDNSYGFGKLTFYTGGSSAQSWRYVAEYAKQFDDEDVIYFLEDDYLHLNNSKEVLLEGIEIADYVSLYDHFDKYIPAIKGGNIFIDEDGGEVTKVFRTKSTHWKLTNSTTMTFATTRKQLIKDWNVWDMFTVGSYPEDLRAFITLRDNGVSLITPIPGYSTHCIPEWASPGIDWEKI
jgi:hypothetical protein